MRHAAVLIALGALAGCGRSAREVPAAQAIRREGRWRWSLPSPQGNTLDAVWGDGARSLVAVGERGAVVASEDGGANWRSVDVPTRASLHGVWGEGRLRVIVGDGGTVLRSEDGGTNWSQVASGVSSELDAVAGRGDRVVAVGRRGDVLESVDAGRSWRVRARRPDLALYAVTLAPDGTAYASGARGVIVRVRTTGSLETVPSGVAWALPGIAHDGASLYVVGWRGTAVRCAGDGGGCAPLRCEVGDDFAEVVATEGGARAVGMGGAVVALTPTQCVRESLDARWSLNGLARGALGEVAVGEHGVILGRVGGVWQTRTAPRSTSFFTVWTREGVVHVGGARGTYLRSDDHGNSWRTVPTGVDDHLVSLRGLGRDTLVALTGGITAARTDDGARWTAAPLGTERAGVALWTVSPTELIAVGARGIVARSEDAGRSWTPARSGVSQALFGLWASGRDDVWAVGSHGTVIHSVDAGRSWETVPSGTEADLTSVWGASRDEVYAVGKSGALLRLDASRRGWSRIATATEASFFGIWGRGPEEIYAVGSAGTVLRGSAHGARWTAEWTGAAEDLLAIWGDAEQVWTVGAAGTILVRR